MRLARRYRITYTYMHILYTVDVCRATVTLFANGANKRLRAQSLCAPSRTTSSRTRRAAAVGDNGHVCPDVDPLSHVNPSPTSTPSRTPSSPTSSASSSSALPCMTTFASTVQAAGGASGPTLRHLPSGLSGWRGSHRKWQVRSGILYVRKVCARVAPGPDCEKTKLWSL